MKLALLLLLICFSSFAQKDVKIVNDPLACGSGIKDHEGNWVLEPEYQGIYPTSTGHILIMQNGLYGLLDQNLKEIIPIGYEIISPFNFQWNQLNVQYGFKLFGPDKIDEQLVFRVKNGKETGLLKDDNTFLIKPREANYYQDTQDFIIMVEKIDGEEFSSYLNIHGTYLFNRVKGKLRPFGNGSTSFACDQHNYRPDYAIGNVRVISRQGKFLSKKSFEKAMICGQNQISVLTESGKIGMIDFQGNMLIKPEYKLKRLNTDAYVPEVFCLGNASEYYKFQNDEGLWGVMLGNGKIIHEAQFDRIEKYDNKSLPHLKYYLLKNGCYGYMFGDLKIAIPPIYKDIVVLTAGTDVTGMPFAILSIKKDGLIGLLNFNGDTILPARYNDCIRMSTNIFYMSRPDGVDQITTNNNNIQVTALELKQEIDDIRIYKDSSGYLTFFNWNSYWQKHHLISKKENFEILNASLLLHYNKKLLIFDRDTNLLQSISVSDKYDKQERYIVIKNDRYNVLLFNTYTNQLTTPDSLYREFRFSKSNERIWAQKLDGNWHIIDTSGSMLIEHSFERLFPLESKYPHITKVNGRYGMIHAKTLEWIIPPTYDCYGMVSSTYFTLTDTLDSHYLFDAQGKMVTHTSFDSIEVLYENFYYDIGIPLTVEAVTWWLIRKDKDSILVNQSGDEVRDRNQIKSMIADFTLNDNPSIPINVKQYGRLLEFSTNFFSNNLGYYEKINRSNLYRSPLRSQVFDTVIKLYNQSQASYGINGVTSNWDFVIKYGYRPEPCMDKFKDQRLKYNVQVNYLDTNVICLSSPYPNLENSPLLTTGHYLSYMNIIWDGNEAKYVTLLELINNESEFLLNEIIAAIKKNDYLKISCTQPEEMLNVIGDNFYFASEGLRLVFPLGDNRSFQLNTVTIPWTNFMSNENCTLINSIFNAKIL